MYCCAGRVYPRDVVYAAGDRNLGTAAYAEGTEDTEYPVVSAVLARCM